MNHWPYSPASPPHFPAAAALCPQSKVQCRGVPPQRLVNYDSRQAPLRAASPSLVRMLWQTWHRELGGGERLRSGGCCWPRWSWRACAGAGRRRQEAAGMARAWGLLLAIGVRHRAGDTCAPRGRGRARSGVAGGVRAGWQRGPGPLRPARAGPGEPLLRVRGPAQLCGGTGLGRPQPRQDPPGRRLHLCECGVEAAFHLRSRRPCSWVGPREQGRVAGWVGSPPPGVLLPHPCDAGSSPGHFRAVWRRGSLNGSAFLPRDGDSQDTR